MPAEPSSKGPARVLFLPGDGIGPEVASAAVRVLKALSPHLTLELLEAPLGGAALDQEGVPVSEKTLEISSEVGAVMIGAVGGPDWDHLPGHQRPEAGLLALRQAMGVYANLRPVRLLPSLSDQSPLKSRIVQRGIDCLVVRELTGGLYYGSRREADRTGGREAADTLIYSRGEIIRVLKTAFRAATSRRGRLTSVDKANVLATSRLWRSLAQEMSPSFPDVELDHVYVDNAAMQMVLRPDSFDVLVTENTFGDILSDLGAALVGSIGMLPSASLGEPGAPGLYEPIHGSAPDIVGTGRSNPVGAILSAAMMLRYSLGRPRLADAVERAVDEVLDQLVATADVAGPDFTVVSTEEMGDRVAERAARLAGLMREE